jgi:PAS domain S-box-containing protein
MVEDVTDKRKAEERLRASEERLRLAAEIGKMYAYDWDAVTDEVVRSPEYANLLGISNDLSLTRTQLSERVHPDDRERWSAAVNKLTPDAPNNWNSYRVVRPDGSEIWLEKNARAFFDDDGKMLRIIGMVADITERKRAEEALRQSEERLRLAQQIGHVGSFERDIRSGLISWTAQLESIHGLPPGAFEGTTVDFFNNLIHPHDRAGVAQLLDKALKTRQPTYGEWRVVWPDGSLHWIAGRWQVLADNSGHPSKMLGINADVTERKTAEQALKRSEEKFSKAFRQGPMALTLTSAKDHRYIDVNQTFEELTGWNREEVIGRTPFDIHIWVHEAERLELVKRVTSGSSVRDMEVHYRRRDGSERIGLGSAEFIEIENEPCVLSVIADITANQQAKEALAGISRKLIEAQEQERTRIARELHDDINQRLALLSVELEASRQNPPESATDINLLLTEIRERIDEISTDLQSLSHQLHSSQLEYLGIVAASRSFCRDFAASQNIQIDFRADDIRTLVSVDVSLCLFRVLQEALYNAAKHSKAGHLEVRLSCSENQLYLMVADKGVGFDSESAFASGGLGLTSMRERVRLVNGTISIDSKPACGTTIYVRVPLEPQQQLRKAV